MALSDSQLLPPSSVAGEIPGLIDQIADTVIATDLEGIIHTWNEAAERVYGYARPEAVGQPIALIYFPEDLRVLADQVIAPLRAKGTHAVEVRGRHKDGSEVWVDVRLTLLRDAAGRANGMLGCGHDVTARRRALLALHRQQEELGVILDSMPAMVWYKDPHNRILRANRAAAAMLGLSPAAIAGRSTYELYPEHAGEYHRDDLEVIRSGTPKLGIVEPIVAADGTRRWVRTDKVPYRDPGGEIVGVIVFAVDITEQQRAEAALAEARDELERRVVARTRALAEANAALRREIAQRQEAERRLDLALWASDLAMWDWDARTNTTVCDARWATMLGYTPAEVPNPSAVWAELTHPDDDGAARRAWRAHVVEGSAPHYEIEQRLRTKGGEYRWVLSRGKVVERDAAGAVVRMAGTNRDITARKAAEEQAARRQAELAHLQRLQTVNHLAAELAHEINQPLGAIANFASGLATHLRKGTGAPAAMLDAAEQIGRQAVRAATVLQRLRDFVRKDTEPATACDLNRLVETATGLVAGEARQCEVILELQLDDALPPVLADAIQIEQVFVNLLRNGLEALAGGSGPRLLTVASRRAAGGAVEVRVRDTGPGIAPDVRAHLFEPFYTTKAHGLGMGLSISRSIVEAHGGRLLLEAGDGPGASFCVVLPAAR